MPDILTGGATLPDPQNGHPKIEVDQLSKPPLETCCTMSSI